MHGTWRWHGCPAPEPSCPSLADKPEWFSELPYFWTKVQVLEWISYHVEKNKYDASSIDFSCCNMDGHALCHCTRDQMRLIFGPLGDELYDRLHEISECPSVPFVPRPGSSKHEAEIPPPDQDPLLPGHCGGLPGGGCTGEAAQGDVAAQTRVQAGLGSAPSMHHSPPYQIGIINPSPPTPAASDELNWIIDLLEKEDATSQETFLDSSHLGKRGAPAKPFPRDNVLMQAGLTPSSLLCPFQSWEIPVLRTPWRT